MAWQVSFDKRNTRFLYSFFAQCQKIVLLSIFILKLILILVEFLEIQSFPPIQHLTGIDYTINKAFFMCLLSWDSYFYVVLFLFFFFPVNEKKPFFAFAITQSSPFPTPEISAVVEDPFVG